VRTNVLDAHPSARLRVYVVWFDMLPGDDRRWTDLQVLNDRRVTNYWDSAKATGRFYAEKVNGYPGVEWDSYFLYGPDARWSDTPAPQLSSGGSVLGASDQLAAAVRPFLSG
jgi:hypothetical protein